MRLTRDTVTRPSRIMLPFYVAWNLTIGLAWMLQDSRRTNPGLAALREYWPIPASGAIIMIVGAVLLLAIVSTSRALGCLALLANAIVYLALVVVFSEPLHLGLDWHPWPVVTIGNPVISLTGFLWPLVPAVASFASFVSVLHEEHPAGPGDRR